MGQNVNEIAADLGITDRHVRRLLHEPGMVEAYSKVRNEFYTDLDKVIRDEKLRPIQRAQAQAIRAQTLVTEILEEVRGRIESGRAKATDLKVGADTAFGIIDRAKGELSGLPNLGRPTAPTMDFNIQQLTLIRNTITESGVDLSDLLMKPPIDVEEVKADAPPVL